MSFKMGNVLCTLEGIRRIWMDREKKKNLFQLNCFDISIPQVQSALLSSGCFSGSSVSSKSKPAGWERLSRAVSQPLAELHPILLSPEIKGVNLMCLFSWWVEAPN